TKAYDAGKMTRPDLERLLVNLPANHPAAKTINGIVNKVTATTEPIDIGQPIPKKPKITPSVPETVEDQRAMDAITGRWTPPPEGAPLAEKPAEDAAAALEQAQAEEVAARQAPQAGIALREQLGREEEEGAILEQAEVTQEAIPFEPAPVVEEEIPEVIEEEEDAEAIPSDEGALLPGEEGELEPEAPEGEYVEGDEGPAIRQRPDEGREDLEQPEPEEPGGEGELEEKPTARFDKYMSYPGKPPIAMYEILSGPNEGSTVSATGLIEQGIE
ncbi:unnamed protein product, partial [marine sediment metagenome]